MSEDLILIQDLIYEIRGKKVMLDFDLAKLYQVKTKALKQAVRRNSERFPEDFMFELTNEEFNSLIIRMRSQFVTSKRGGTRWIPFAFTEQGVAMLSGILKSDIAIATNIAIMRAFVKVRESLMAATAVSLELKELKAKVDLLQMQQEENLGAVNDLSEDVRKDIDNLYLAIGELSTKIDHNKKTRRNSKIGFKQSQ